MRLSKCETNDTSSPSQPLRADARPLRREGLQPKANAGAPGAVQGKPRWRLGEEELSLFEGDRAALQALPPQELSCVRWEQRKCNRQGVLTLAGIHRYSAGPD